MSRYQENECLYHSVTQLSHMLTHNFLLPLSQLRCQLFSSTGLTYPIAPSLLASSCWSPFSVSFPLAASCCCYLCPSTTQSSLRSFSSLLLSESFAAATVPTVRTPWELSCCHCCYTFNLLNTLVTPNLIEILKQLLKNQGTAWKLIKARACTVNTAQIWKYSLNKSCCRLNIR